MSHARPSTSNHPQTKLTRISVVFYHPAEELRAQKAEAVLKHSKYVGFIPNLCDTTVTVGQMKLNSISMKSQQSISGSLKKANQMHDCATAA